MWQVRLALICGIEADLRIRITDLRSRMRIRKQFTGEYTRCR